MDTFHFGQLPYSFIFLTNLFCAVLIFNFKSVPKLVKNSQITIWINTWKKLIKRFCFFADFLRIFWDSGWVLKYIQHFDLKIESTLLWNDLYAASRRLKRSRRKFKSRAKGISTNIVRKELKHEDCVDCLVN